MRKIVLVISICLITALLTAQSNRLTPPEHIDGPWKEKILREHWYFPLKTNTPEYMSAVRKQIDAMPDEALFSSAKTMAVNAWENIGPFGILPSSSIRYSGRVTDVEYPKAGTIRVLSATGGLWQIDSMPNGTITYHTLSDYLDCNSGGAFVSDPINSDIIWLGTGEGGLSGGCGLWKTTDAGITWIQVPLNPTPTNFYEMILVNSNPQKLYAATNVGLYQSDDGGTTWARTKLGEITDVVVNPTNTNLITVAQWNSGIYNSNDGGANFTKNTSAPITNVGRTALDIAMSAPSTIYANITKNTNNNTLGIYKSADDGNTWTICTLGNDLGGNPSTGDFHWGQGWYNNTIAVSQNDPNLVIAGGGGLWRSTNGNLFNEIDARHADQHAAVFTPTNWAIIGNDGGVFISKNNSFSFNTLNTFTNALPITQFIDCSVSKAAATTMLGGTQDNGTVHRSTSVPNFSTTGGDGGGVASDPFDGDKMYTAVGVYGGPHSFHRHFTQDGGMSWQDNTTGMDPNGQWYPPLRIDYGFDALYTAAGKNCYRTFDFGATWEKLNASSPFNGGDCNSLSIDVSGSSDPSIYALLWSNPMKLRVRDRNLLTWVDRTANLPSLKYNQVQADFVLPDRVFITVTEVSANAAGNKVFRSDDIGITWTNISGNLPNVPVTDILPSPLNPDVYYIATMEGGFKTLDGGQTWVKWANGLPKRVEMTKLDYVDSSAINGKFYILASTYGRGLWMREVSGDDPLGIDNHANNNDFKAISVFPNPTISNTTLRFNVPISQYITITVYDIAGKTVIAPISKYFVKGLQSIDLPVTAIAPGTYMVEVTSSTSTIMQKLVKM